MKRGKLFLAAALATTMGCQTAPAMADVNVHISLGGPRAVAYHPIYHGDYFYHAGYFPNLLFIPQLGFYVSIGSPYDLLFFNNFYYVYHGGHWYHSHYYNGPWIAVKHNRPPRAIRRHHWHKIREYSDREYRRHHRYHRWLKHRDDRHHVYKERRKSIRNSAHYQPVPRHSGKFYKGKSDYDGKKIYRKRSGDERRNAYWVRPENEKRKAYKVRTDRDKRTVYKERKKIKTWRNNEGERIVVKEKTTKTKRWAKQNDNRKGKHWAENRATHKENRYFKNRNRSGGEVKENSRGREIERSAKRWARVNDRR